MDKAVLNKLKNELGDDVDELKKSITQLIQKVFGEALDEGSKAIATDRQNNAFRKAVLDSGNNAIRELGKVFEGYACLRAYETKTDVFNFNNNGNVKEGNSNGEGSK